MTTSAPADRLVHIVDDDEGMRRGLGVLLEAAGYSVRLYPSAGDFLVALEGEARGCLLLDLKMPGPSGLELQKALARHGESMPVVFLSGHADVESTVQAMRAGASDFLTKPVDRATLLAALDRAFAEEGTRRAARDELRTLESRYATLTQREREVLHLVVAGRLNKQIAGDIGMAERTVKAHRAQVMAKMRVTSVADLVRAASRLGVPAPGHPSTRFVSE